MRFCAVPCPSVRCGRSLPCGAALCGAVLCSVLCCTYSFIPGTCQVSFDKVSYSSTIAVAQQSSAVRCRALPCGRACRAVRYCAVLCRAVPCCAALDPSYTPGLIRRSGVIQQHRGTPHQVCTSYIVESQTMHSQLSSAQL